jgi:hypothetical protein
MDNRLVTLGGTGRYAYETGADVLVPQRDIAHLKRTRRA